MFVKCLKRIGREIVRQMEHLRKSRRELKQTKKKRS